MRHNGREDGYQCVWTRPTAESSKRRVRRGSFARLSPPLSEFASEMLQDGRRGRATVALARQVAIYLAHTRLGLPYCARGAVFGRDRTTAAHACRRVEDRREDPRLRHDDRLSRARHRSAAGPRQAPRGHAVRDAGEDREAVRLLRRLSSSGRAPSPADRKLSDGLVARGFIARDGKGAVSHHRERAGVPAAEAVRSRRLCRTASDARHDRHQRRGPRASRVTVNHDESPLAWMRRHKGRDGRAADRRRRVRRRRTSARRLHARPDDAEGDRQLDRIGRPRPPRRRRGRCRRAHRGRRSRRGGALPRRSTRSVRNSPGSSSISAAS